MAKMLIHLLVAAVTAFAVSWYLQSQDVSAQKAIAAIAKQQKQPAPADNAANKPE